MHVVPQTPVVAVAPEQIPAYLVPHPVDWVQAMHEVPEQRPVAQLVATLPVAVVESQAE